MHKSGKLIAVLFSIAWISTNAAAQGAAATAGIDPALLGKANAGHADAEFLVGTKYELGARVPQDLAQAAAWYRKAADQGDVRAEHSLGVMYEFGHGVPLDYAQAANWYRKAAERGFAPAQFSLGLCYAHGKGVPEDYKQAVEWYGKAAAQKNTDALLNLAYLYHNGIGVPKDEKRSFDLVRQAADAGSADAQFQLGMDYEGGEQGLQQDEELARKWLHRSAAQGHVAAQFNYAMMLKAEPAEVYFWLSLATPHLSGDSGQKSKQLRDTAGARLTAQQRTQIDAKVKNWHPAIED